MKKSTYEYCGVVYRNQKELAEALGLSIKAISQIVAKQEYMGKAVKVHTTENKLKRGNIKYHGTTYTTTKELGRDFALSPQAIAKLDNSELTESYIYSVIEEDRARWLSKTLFLNKRCMGTVKEFIHVSGCMYTELMREYFTKSRKIFGMIEIF